MSVEVRLDAGRLVVTLGDELEEPMRDLLARQLRDVAADGPIVIDVSRITLRPADVRSLQDLLARLGDCEVWLACSRLSGRRVLNRLLERPCTVVRHPDDVPAIVGRRDPARGEAPISASRLPVRPPPRRPAQPIS